MNIHIWNGIGCTLGAILTIGTGYLIFRYVSKKITDNNEEWLDYPHAIVPGGILMIIGMSLTGAAWAEFGLGVFNP
jgi:accessory gene regulator protein AgrB